MVAMIAKHIPCSLESITRKVLLKKLEENGVKGVFLIMDPRIGGNKYKSNLLKALKMEKPDIEQLGVELFYPAWHKFRATDYYLHT